MATDIATLGIRVTTDGVRAAARDLDNLGDAGRRAERHVERFKVGIDHLVKILSAYVGLNTAQEILRTADAWKTLEGRLALVEKSFGGAIARQQELYELAQRSLAPIHETVTLYTRLAPALQQIGKGSAEAMKMTEAVALALKVSGATALESASAMIQFSQAMAAGRLGGEEFAAVAETAPRLMDALAKSLGVPRGALKELAAQGVITAEVMYQALTSELPKLKEEFAQLPLTVDAAMTKVQNAFAKAIGDLDKRWQFSDAIAREIEEFAGMVEQYLAPVASTLVLGAKLAAGYFLIFKGAPAILAAASTAITALNGSIFTTSVAANLATGALTKLKLAQFALFAGFAGWELGKWLTENFVEAELAGIAMVNGLLKGWEYIKFAATAAWEVVKFGWGTALDAMRTRFGTFVELVASGLDLIPGFDQEAAGLHAWAAELKTATTTVDGLKARLGELAGERDAEIATIEAITGEMADEAIARRHVAEAAEKQGEAAKKTAKTTQENKAVTNAYANALEDLRRALKAYDAEQAKSLALQNEGEKSAIDELASLKESLRALEDQTAQIGLSSEQLTELTARRLESAASLKEDTAAALAAMDPNSRLVELYRQQAEVLRGMAAETRNGSQRQAVVQQAEDALNAQAEAWRSIEDVAHDTFISIFDSGKDAFERLRDTLKNTVYELLYQMTVKRWIIQIATSMGGSDLAQAAFGATGGTGSDGWLGLAKNLYGAYQGGSNLGLWGSSAGVGSSGLVSAGVYEGGQMVAAPVYERSLSGMGGTDVWANGGAGSAMGAVGGAFSGYTLGKKLTGSDAGGAVGAAAGAYYAYTIPYVGWILAALALIAGTMGGGTPHVGAAVLTGLDDSQRRLKHEEEVGDTRVWGGFKDGGAFEEPLRQMGYDVQRSIEGILGEFGSSRQVSVYSAFGADGEDASRGNLRIYDEQGNLLAANSDQALRGKKYDDDPRKGFEQFAQDSARVIRDALVAADLPAWVDSVLESLGDKPSMEALNTALAQIEQVRMAAELAGPALGLTEEGLAGVIEASGNYQMSMQSLGMIMDTTLDANQRWNWATEQLARQFADINVALPTSTEGFRNLLKSLDLTDESDQKLYASLLQLYPAFSQLATAVDQVFDSISAKTGDLVTQFQMDILNNEEKYAYLDDRIVQTLDQLSQATDPSTIQSLYDKAASDLQASWQLLSDDEKRRLSAEFEDRAYDLESLSQSRLSVAPQAETTEPTDEMRTAAADQKKASEEAKAAAAEMRGAAESMNEAADEMHAAAESLKERLDIRLVVAGSEVGYS